MKRDKKLFLFHQGRSQDFDEAGEVDKKRVQTLKIAFENVSKIDYIALVSGHLKDIGYSLNPKYLKIRA